MSSHHLVVFCDTKHSTPWYLRFLKKGFRHCFIVYNLFEELQIIYEVVRGKIEKSTLEMSIEQVEIFYANEPSFFVVPVAKGNHDRSNEPKFPKHNTCVGLTKRILGLKKPLIQTPYQLFKLLLP